jgi:hypothetical protein
MDGENEENGKNTDESKSNHGPLPGVDPNILRILEQEAARIREKYNLNAVQIFATKSHGSLGQGYHGGAGDYYSRYGRVRQWLIREEEIERKSAWN